MTEPTYSIIYTHTDEAPALATYSFLPIIQAFAGVVWGPRGNSGHLPCGSHHRELLRASDCRTTHSRRFSRNLAPWPKQPQANIIKLPNISASIPQLKAAVKELQGKRLRPAGLSRRAQQ